MRKAIFPGSFDPLTKGHIDIIERASNLFDQLAVVILHNSNKKSMFTKEERIHFIESACKHLDNVEVFAYDGLTIDAARNYEACALVRGVRSIKDYEYEMEIAAINKKIDSSIETILLYSDPTLHMVSSSTVKELLRYGQDISDYVSDEVQEALLRLK